METESKQDLETILSKEYREMLRDILERHEDRMDLGTDFDRDLCVEVLSGIYAGMISQELPCWISRCAVREKTGRLDKFKKACYYLDLAGMMVVDFSLVDEECQPSITWKEIGKMLKKSKSLLDLVATDQKIREEYDILEDDLEFYERRIFQMEEYFGVYANLITKLRAKIEKENQNINKVVRQFKYVTEENPHGAWDWITRYKLSHVRNTRIDLIVGTYSRLLKVIRTGDEEKIRESLRTVQEAIIDYSPRKFKFVWEERDAQGVRYKGDPNGRTIFKSAIYHVKRKMPPDRYNLFKRCLIAEGIVKSAKKQPAQSA